MHDRATPKDVDRAYRVSRHPRDRERLLAVLMSQQGRCTLAQISSSLDRGPATISRWLRAYREGGIEKLLYRGHGGRSASLSESDQDALMERLRSGRWERGQNIQVWLREERGIDLSLSGVYYWIRRLKGSREVPRKSDVGL